VECAVRRCPCDAARPDLCEVEIEATGDCRIATTAGQEKGGSCGLGEQLVVSPRGYGLCSCVTRPPHVLWRTTGEPEETGRCYPLFHQGPCEAGYQLTYSRSRLEPVCRPALCEDGSVFMANDGACYPLDQPGGPCPELHVLSLDINSLEPVCRLDESQVKRVYGDIPPGVITDAPLNAELVIQDCRQDRKGRCIRPFGGGQPLPTGGAGSARGYVSWLKSFRG
jgi:hypothetical protein